MALLSLQAAGATQFAGRPARSVVQLPARAARKQQRIVAQAAKPETDVVDENIGEYCSLDQFARRPTRELTLGEKEELFLEAMAAYYYNEKPMLSNEEFDNLKDELQWEGSKVVIMTSTEKRFLEARLAYAKGEPFMTDAEYDALKASLGNSSVFVRSTEGPSCSIGSAPGKRGQERGQATIDWAKLLALSTPAALVAAGTIVGTDVLIGGALLRIPGPIGVAVWGGLLLPAMYVITNAIKSFLFKDALILKAPCPNCGEENSTYFGDILTVEGSRETNVVTCPCCQSKLTFDAKERMVIVTELGNSAKAAA